MCIYVQSKIISITVKQFFLLIILKTLNLYIFYQAYQATVFNVHMYLLLKNKIEQIEGFYSLSGQTVFK